MTDSLALLPFILMPVLYHLMRKYYAEQRVQHFRKKSGRTFVNNPVQRYF